MSDVNDEGIAAVLGLVLLTQPDTEVRVPIEIIEKGLPANSGIQVYQDQVTDELVVRITENK